ncbi:Dynamin [Fasciola gigantica]|uniref:dynamin GTPase n=1 Tax=Fasciola gigantica TaxID=46835 RepID=A0A504Y4K5_FASGI|nr:Dynamin [Fasciola gigantica]
MLRREIGIAIQNIHAVRPGLFTPDKAFDATVRKLIDKLRVPSMKCVDLVVSKLIEVVQHCAEKISRFPRLRDEVVRLVNMRIRELEIGTRTQIQTLVDFQLAYTNTNHEDFIGFRNAEQKATDSSKGKLGNQVICKGWLIHVNPNLFRGGSRYFWFVLTADTLRWFKDDEEREVKYVLQLDGLKQRSGDTGFFSRRSTFILFHPDGKTNVYKDYKTLDLSADTQEAVEAWKAALLRAGVYPERTAKREDDASDDGDGTETNDPKLERQIEIIRNLVDSYMKIVNKTQRDMVPKVVMHSLLNQVKQYLNSDLVPSLYTQDTNLLMEESDMEKQNREEIIRMYESMEEAMRIIGEVISNTQSVPLPPPVNDDWLETTQENPSLNTGGQRRLAPSTTSGSHPSIPQRPTTPTGLPTSVSSSNLGAGSTLSSRPMPTRPAPNLPVRGLAPAPAIPHRNPYFANGVSSSTGNLPRTVASTMSSNNTNFGSGTGLSYMGNGGGNGSGSHAAWMQFDPLLNHQSSSVSSAQRHAQPPAPPPKGSTLAAVAAIAGHPIIPERPTNSSFPRIPPRPTN